MLNRDEMLLREGYMLRDTTVTMQDGRREITLGDETLTMDEALALWLWLLAEERDAARLSVLESHTSRACCGATRGSLAR